MGIITALNLHRYAAETRNELHTPYGAHPAQLESIVWADLFDREHLPPTRAAAMRVPAIARARSLVAPTIARCPLTVWRRDIQLSGLAEPSWIHRSSTDLTPYHRMLWTIDDLIFYGLSLWIVDRGSAGQILDAARVPWEWWRTEPETGRILVSERGTGDPRPVPADTVVLIPGPHEGILCYGQTAISQAAALGDTAADRAENPAAIVELHYSGDRELTDAEIDALLSRWRKARKAPGGSVGYTSKHVELRTHDTSDATLLIDGRNAAAVECARIVGVPAAMIDATAPQSSLRYENLAGRNAEFVDYGLSQYLDSVAARLSADDVVPAGQSVRFDTSVLRDPTPSATGPVTND